MVDGQITDLAWAPVAFRAGEWHEMKIDLVRGKVKVYVEGEVVLSEKDPEEHLESGHLTFGCRGGSDVAFRNITRARL